MNEDSCEACKQRKVKCGKYEIDQLKALLTASVQTVRGQPVAGVLEINIPANTKSARNLVSERATEESSKVASIDWRL